LPLNDYEIENILENHKEKLVIIDGKLDEHDEKINYHEEKINQLNLNFIEIHIRTDERLNNLEKIIKENSNLTMQGNTLIYQALQSNTTLLQNVISEMSKISTIALQNQRKMNNDDIQLEIQTNKSENKKSITLGLFAFLGTIGGYFFGKNQ